MKRVIIGLALSLAGCFDVSLPSKPPPPPTPGDGVVVGSVVYAQPGQTTLRPAIGATIELVGAGVSTKASGDTAAFSLSPVNSPNGSVLFRFDVDGDGQFDKQKLIDLRDLNPGPGKTITLGEVVLGSNGTVRGQAIRGDVQSPGGHAGTSILVPEGPYFAYTADDGSFVLDTLPEGKLTVAIYRDGYRAEIETLEVRSAEVFTMRKVVLSATTGSTVAELRGKVFLPGRVPAPDVTVTTSTGATATTDAQGAWTIRGVPFGILSIAFAKTEYRTARLINLVVAAPIVAVRDVTLEPGTSTMPQLDAGLPPFDGGVDVDAGIDAGVDAGIDAGVDAGIDAGVDAGIDAGVDAGIDAGVDAGIDAGVDAGIDAGVDAGIDAGVDAGIDAGVDAGIDAGVDAGIDAGVDAGIDAGVDAGIDAGVDAGIDAGRIDAGVDAGFDAGPPPTAIIDVPLYVPINTNFTMRGDRSTGGPGLSYFWSQDAGTNLIPSITTNGTPFAATPALRSPGLPQVLKFTLTVTDSIGRTSQPTSVMLPVAIPPVAVITGTPTGTVFGGQRLFFSGLGSSDPNGTGIADYQWSVTPTTVGIVATPMGSTLMLDMPSSVSTPSVVTVRLVVANGLTLQSAPVTATFTLGFGSLPQWYVDAGLPQQLGSGSVVTLSGAAFSPQPDAGFTYLWTPDREPDSGVADWILTDPTSPQTTFIAPRIDGPVPRTIVLRLTATDTTGTLTPPTKFSDTVITVLDRRPPQVVATSVSTGSQGLLSAWVDFDEDIAPTSGSIFVEGLPGSPAVNSYNRTVIGRRAYIAVRYPPTLTYQYRLVVSGVTDLAIPPNPITAVQQSFVAQPRWSPAWETASTSTNEPWPALIVRKPVVGQPLQVFLAGRKNGAAWFTQPFDPSTCSTPPCVIADDTSAPSPTLSGPMPRGHRGVLYGNTPVATLQVADLTGTPASVWWWNGAWEPLPVQPPGTIFTNPNGLLSPYADDGGLRLAGWDGGAAWGRISTLSTDTVEWSVDALSDPIAFGTTSPQGGNLLIAGRMSKTGGLRMFHQAVGSTTWFSTTMSGPNILEARSVFDTFPSQYGRPYTLRSTGLVENYCFVGCGAGPYPMYTNVQTYDVVGNYGTANMIATSVNGLLELRYEDTRLVPGPLRNGMPSTMLNNDPSCWADRPELFSLEARMVIAWQERCGSGPWRMYVRLGE